MFHTQNVSRYLHFKEVSINTEIWGTESKWWFQPTSLMRSHLQRRDLSTGMFKWVTEKPIRHNSKMVGVFCSESSTMHEMMGHFHNTAFPNSRSPMTTAKHCWGGPCNGIGIPLPSQKACFFRQCWK